jgi:hypothetical protein
MIGHRGGRVATADPAYLVKQLAEIVQAEIKRTAAATAAIDQIRQTPRRPQIEWDIVLSLAELCPHAMSSAHVYLLNWYSRIAG